MTKIGIFGTGGIAQGCIYFLDKLNLSCMTWGKEPQASIVRYIDLSERSDIVEELLAHKITHVINALPFMYNERVASAAAEARCHYLDFTEDDAAGSAVQAIYRGHPELTCAVKCGLAPGFINYLGYDLSRDTEGEIPRSLLIGVGALPKSISGHETYNITWSVEGLANEYLKPCLARREGKIVKVSPLSGQMQLIIDGLLYEMANTSGGVGSLVQELTHVPNVAYKTIRYPHHFDHVREMIKAIRYNGLYDPTGKAEIKSEGEVLTDLIKHFKTFFYHTRDDVVVVYAEYKYIVNEELHRKTFSRRFYGIDGLTAIQSTTAGAGIAVLEMMLDGQLTGIIDHSTVDLEKFKSTSTYKLAYR
jgi:saccharopine dehydrogenase-like NADP-dependent oxidoreductase